MTLSNWEKQAVLDRLDEMDRMTAVRVTATQDSFERWLAYRLPEIYRKIKTALRQAWSWFRSLFY